MRSKYTFPSTVFESWANNHVWYLFETLPLATRFIPEPVVFLIEVNFRKGSKNGTRRKQKFGTSDTFVVNSMNFIPLFSQSRFECNIASTFRSLEVLFFQKLLWFEQKLGFVCQTTCFFVVSWTSGCLSANFLKKMQVSFQNCLLEIARLFFVEFFHNLCRQNAQKLYRKLPKTAI